MRRTLHATIAALLTLTCAAIPASAQDHSDTHTDTDPACLLVIDQEITLTPLDAAPPEAETADNPPDDDNTSLALTDPDAAGPLSCVTIDLWGGQTIQAWVHNQCDTTLTLNAWDAERPDSALILAPGDGVDIALGDMNALTPLPDSDIHYAFDRTYHLALDDLQGEARIQATVESSPGSCDEDCMGGFFPFLQCTAVAPSRRAPTPLAPISALTFAAIAGLAWRRRRA